MNDQPERPERPATLRRGPRPTPDEHVDPVDYITSASIAPEPVAPLRAAEEEVATATQTVETIATGRPGRPRRREITMPFSTRLTVEIVDLIDAAVQREGITQRAAVEMAIQEKWGRL